MTNEKLTGSQSLYDICGLVVLNTNSNGMFAEVEKYNTGEKKLTPQEFELLGAIAYFHGLQFTTQRNSFTKKTMENFQMRMNAHKIDLDFQEKIRNFIEAVDFGVINVANEDMKNLITSTITTNAELGSFIKEQFKEIVDFSVFDISLSEQVYDLESKENITYSDILMMNKLIFEDFELVSDAFVPIEKLYGNMTFVAELNVASRYYDSTKFSFVFLDSILTLKEWYAEFPLLSDTYIDINVDEIVDVVVDYTANETAPKSIPAPTVQVDNSLTDKFLRAVLMEAKEGSEINKLENADKLVLAVKDALENQDILPNVYKFIKANLTVNREDLNLVYGFDVTPFIEQINTIYLDLRKDLNLITVDFLDTIDTDTHSELITFVDSTIKAIVIDGREKKGYLMNQITKNQIETINHLHQMLGLIETCKIVGGRGYENYVKLIGYIFNKAPHIQEIFNKVENTEQIKLEINYYKAILDFFKQEKSE